MEFSNVDCSVAKKQGNVGVSRAIYEFTKMGYTVLVPLSDSDKYDIVVDDGVSLSKVQVKTSRCSSNSGGFNVNLKTSGGNTKKNTVKKRSISDYDFLFVLAESGDCWFIPNKELGEAGTSIVVGGKKYSEFKL